jgi:hypothetical protein
MKHEINVEDLLKWKSEQKLLYCADSKGRKQLFVSCNNSYEIYVDNIKVYESIQACPAIDKYNSL